MLCIKIIDVKRIIILAKIFGYKVSFTFFNSQNLWHDILKIKCFVLVKVLIPFLSSLNWAIILIRVYWKVMDQQFILIVYVPILYFIWQWWIPCLFFTWSYIYTFWLYTWVLLTNIHQLVMFFFEIWSWKWMWLTMLLYIFIFKSRAPSL